MTTAVIRKFQTERDEVIAQAEAIMERDDFDPKDEAYMALKERAEYLNTTLGSLQEFGQQKAAADALDAALAQGHQPTLESRSGVNSELTSPGEFFVRSAEWQQHAAGGFLGRSRPVAVDGMLKTRAAHTTSDFWMIDTVRERPEPAARTPILDSLSIIPVTTNQVDVVTYQWQFGADVVAEGAPKPESTLAQAVTSYTLDTIAHYVDVSRQLLADSAAVARKVDEGLRRGVLKKLESEAAGAVSGGTYANVTSTGEMLAGVREAVGNLQDLGYSPDTLYLAPADWAALDVAVQGQQTQGATGVLQRSYWGLTVVPLAGLATPIVADAREAFESYRRSAVQVFTTDSDGSKFLSNIITLLGEARQKTIVVNAEAAQTVTA